MTWPLFVSFYTDDDIYRPAGERLIASLEKFNLPHDIEIIPRDGTLSSVQKKKPAFMLSKLEKHKKNIVWIDADNEVLHLPEALKKVDQFDVAVVRFEQFDWELNSSLVSINNNDMGRKILATWGYATYQDERHGDQFALHLTVQHYSLRGARIGMLPLSYAGEERETAIIYQHHASIEGRKAYGL